MKGSVKHTVRRKGLSVCCLPQNGRACASALLGTVTVVSWSIEAFLYCSQTGFMDLPRVFFSTQAQTCLISWQTRFITILKRQFTKELGLPLCSTRLFLRPVVPRFREMFRLSCQNVISSAAEGPRWFNGPVIEADAYSSIGRVGLTIWMPIYGWVRRSPAVDDKWRTVRPQ